MHLSLLIYGSLDSVSGGYLYDRRLVEYLRAQGDTVDILSLPWRNYPAHLTDNLALSGTKWRRNAKHDLLIQDELCHPSLLLANRGPHTCPILSLVHHLRCTEPRPAWQNALYRIPEQHYLRSVDGFIFNSRTTRAEVEALVPPRPHIIAYPPTDRFGLRTTEQEVLDRAHQPGPLRLLFLGNLIYRKGLHTLLDSLSLLAPGVHLDIVGSLTAETSYARRLQQQASAMGLSSSVAFHGPLSDQPLMDLLSHAHLLVLPSSYEGFGIVYLEGMGFGLPAIGTTLGAAREIITDGTDGFLVPPDDPRALAAPLDRLSQDRDLLARMSLAALDRYQRQPSWTDTASSIRQFLMEMQASHR